MSAESTELLEAFKAAALSVTKLYKTSASAQAKSRADGYQDCLEDLLSFLDRENIGLANGGEGQRIRRWATERLEGRDATSPPLDSDDEADKCEGAPASSPQMPRSVPAATPQLTADKSEVLMRDSAPPVLASVPSPPSPVAEEVDIVVPSQETFTFQSSHPYPQDAAMRLADLDLSDSQPHGPSSNRTTSRYRGNRLARNGAWGTLGRGAGQKRKVNLAEIFDLGSLDYGNGKDMFGGGGKRSRHV